MLKKVIIGLQVVILIAVIFLFYKSYSSPQSEKYVFDDKGKQVAKLTENDIIVYYDQDSLMKKSNYIDSIQTQLKYSGERWQQQLNIKKKQYEDWAVLMQGKAARKELTALEQQQAQQTDYDKQMELQDLQLKAEENFTQKQMEAMKLVNEAILKTVKEINVRKKIKFVLAYSGASQVVMPTESALNVTADMVEIINNIYKTKAK